MSVDEKLVAKGYSAPQDLTFDEAVTLAKQLDFEEVGGKGSHQVFRHPK